MLYCPKCGSRLPPSLDVPDWVCSQCDWTYNGGNILRIESGPVEKKLILESPKIGRSHVCETRYLTHCTNIAHIIAHCNTRSLRFERIKDYLRITKEEEVV